MPANEKGNPRIVIRESYAAVEMYKKIFFLVVSAMMLSKRTRRGPGGLGVTNGNLLPCPNSPNCVSSQTVDEARYVNPLRYEGTLGEARDRVLSLLGSMERVRIVIAEENYIRAEFTSALFRFVDDVEFYLDGDGKTIHVKSASRIGYSDLGVNRRRVETIRKKFLEMTPRANRKTNER